MNIIAKSNDNPKWNQVFAIDFEARTIKHVTGFKRKRYQSKEDAYKLAMKTDRPELADDIACFLESGLDFKF